MEHSSFCSDHIPKADRHKFSPEEDIIIRTLVEKHGKKRWKKIAAFIPGRTARQCRERYIYYLQPHLINGPWTVEEDNMLIEKYGEMGPKWAKMTEFFYSRSDVNLKNHWAALIRRKKVPKHLLVETQNKINSVFNKEIIQEIEHIPIKNKNRDVLSFFSECEKNLVKEVGMIFDDDSWKSLFQSQNFQ